MTPENISAPVLPEPWLRGPLAGVDPLLAPTIQALLQAEEDLQTHTRGLRDDQIWEQPYGLASLGFHLRHIAGSLDRLTTYLVRGELNETQMAFLRAESHPGATLDVLMRDAVSSLRSTAAAIGTLDVNFLRDPRRVGRKHLPTTAMGLVVHLAEHTQRHVGQAITTSKLLLALQAKGNHGERR